MKYQSREMWYKDYMRMIDDEYEDYGFIDDSDPYDDEYDEADYDELLPGEDDDEILTIPDRFLRLKDIEIPDDETDQRRKLKRDLRMEALRRIEQSARTVADFRKLNMWYDTLDNNEWRRQHSHEIIRSGDEFPLEYGEKHCGAVFPGYMSDVISWQMRKGDFLDAIYCKPETIDELVTTDYIIHFMRAMDEDEKKLFYFKVLESLSSGEIAEMKGQTDRAVRKTWNQMITHIRQKAMGVLIFRSDKDYSFTGQEQEFLDTCREQYEYRIEV